MLYCLRVKEPVVDEENDKKSTLMTMMASHPHHRHLVAKHFWVVAIPNPNKEVSLSGFQASLTETLQDCASDLHYHPHYRIQIRAVTQMVDGEDMGECFLVQLVTIQDEDGTNDDDDDWGLDDDPTSVVPNNEWVLKRLFPNCGAEIWVEGQQGGIPLAPPYGWKKDTFCCREDDSSIQHALQTYGLAFVLQNSKTSCPAEKVRDVCRDAKAQLRTHIATLEDAVKENHPHIRLGESAFGFADFTHRGPERFEALLDPDSSLYGMLRKGLEHQWIDSVSRYLQLEPDHIRLNISCVYSRPGATDQDWHTDGDHYDWHSSTTKPYAVCIFCPLIPLTAETGYTRFWPQSHRYPNLLGLARAADALQATIDGVNLEPGDYILYDYTTWHKGMGNSTQNMERPVLQFLYSANWYKERKNYGTKSVFDKP